VTAEPLFLAPSVDEPVCQTSYMLFLL